MPHEGVVITQIIDIGQLKVCPFVNEYCCTYTSRGADPRCSFRRIGQCEGLSKWNERQELAPRLFRMGTT